MNKPKVFSVLTVCLSLTLLALTFLGCESQPQPAARQQAPARSSNSGQASQAVIENPITATRAIIPTNFAKFFIKNSLNIFYGTYIP